MSIKVFATGVTGYVGGDALHIILQAHPDWQYSLLVRDRTRLGSIANEYPSVRVVEGDLNSVGLLKSEAAAADIVLHFASSDDAPAVRAILEGLGSDSKTRFLIHTSGAANLLYDDMISGNVGNKSTKVYDDLADIATITSFPDAVFHRPVDKLVLEASNKYPNVRTAVVCPPAIIGVGRGPGNTRTIQIPMLIELSRKRGKAFQLGKGEATWNLIHIHDLSDVYYRLTEAAAAGGGKADWGPEAYYFAEGGELEWGALTKRVATLLHEAGALESAEVDAVSAEEAGEIHPFFGMAAGKNSRSRASRARKVLGWSPKIEDFEESLREAVEVNLKAKVGRMEEIEQGRFPAPAKE
ncbi:NAD(P)-binding protein [Karstenula rhodostoma CBS 690.94]|uniref:NAD(P)-binding protein n=1 Tax=Karstenula rhodostoma CBS 690.94 TaxID=1392251 RepID=A0A9P4UFV6_9PLEO|nr:NAD(P)-binding protein [Karstenula rhodostoma CBS 690.94]